MAGRNLTGTRLSVRAGWVLERLALIGLVLIFLAALSGCGEESQAAVTTPSPRLARLIPADESWYNQPRRDDAGNIQRDYYAKPLVIPWIVSSEPLLGLSDVATVNNPGTDSSGRPTVVIRLNSEGSRKLEQRLVAQPLTLALMVDNEVKSTGSVAGPFDEVVFTCTAREALKLEKTFAQAGS
jgi:hypothetical protein